MLQQATAAIAIVAAALSLGIVGCGGSVTGTLPTAPDAVGPVAPVLRGFVRDTSFTPVADAKVEIVNGSAAGTFTMSGPRGEFSLEGVAVSDTILAMKDGYVAATRIIDSSQWFSSGLTFELQAVGPRVDISGNYELTMIADAACDDLPEAMRSRTYSARITDFGMVSGATFFRFYHEFATYIGDLVRFSTEFDGSPWLVEEVAQNTYLAFHGSAATTVQAPASTIVAAFDGWVEYCSMSSPMDAFYRCSRAVPADRVVRCVSQNHQLRLTRR